MFIVLPLELRKQGSRLLNYIFDPWGGVRGRLPERELLDSSVRIDGRGALLNYQHRERKGKAVKEFDGIRAEGRMKV